MAKMSVEYYTEDFAHARGKYSKGHYLHRNLLFAELIHPYRVKKVIEMAAAEGNLAHLMLSQDDSIERYDASDYCPSALKEMRKNIGNDPRTQLSILDAEDYTKVPWEEYDCFVCTALEHIERDREIIASTKKGTIIALSLPNFDCEGHVRYFPKMQDAIDRYADLVQWEVMKEVEVVISITQLRRMCKRIGVIDLYIRIGKTLGVESECLPPMVKYILIGRRL